MAQWLPVSSGAAGCLQSRFWRIRSSVDTQEEGLLVPVV